MTKKLLCGLVFLFCLLIYPVMSEERLVVSGILEHFDATFTYNIKFKGVSEINCRILTKPEILFEGRKYNLYIHDNFLFDEYRLEQMTEGE